MKQTDPKEIEQALDMLEALKEKRGGSILDFHKKIANHKEMLQAFNQQFDICKKDLKHIPPKYKELIIFAIGCARNAETTMKTHARIAYQEGATIEEIGEVLRLVFFLCGATGVITAAEIFDVLEGSEDM